MEEEWLREEEKLKEQEKNVSSSLLFYDTKKEHFPQSPLPHTISFEKYKNILGSSRSPGNNVVHHRKFCRV